VNEFKLRAGRLVERGARGGLDIFTLMANHDDDPRRVEPGRGPQHVRNQWTTSEFVEDLCLVTLHASSKSRREDQDIDRFLCHDNFIPSDCRSGQ
jgi:hypothetical protein